MLTGSILELQQPSRRMLSKPSAFGKWPLSSDTTFSRSSLIPTRRLDLDYTPLAVTANDRSSIGYTAGQWSCARRDITSHVHYLINLDIHHPSSLDSFTTHQHNMVRKPAATHPQDKSKNKNNTKTKEQSEHYEHSLQNQSSLPTVVSPTQ